MSVYPAERESFSFTIWLSIKDGGRDGPCIPPLESEKYCLFVVEGWHKKYIICLIETSTATSICIIIAATAITHSIDSGSLAGSYALAIASILLRLLTALRTF